MNNKIKQIVSLSLVLLAVSVMAKENVYNPGATSVVNTKVAAGCDPSTSQTDLDVNNIVNLKSEIKKWLSKKVNIFALYKHEYYNEKEDFQFKVGLGVKLWN